MLDPRDRHMFMEALRVPPDCTLDCAVGTTFSLDLMSLLIAPIAFTVFDWDDDRPLAQLDPLPLLDAVREHADRLSLFCQAGHITIPSAYHWLLAHLEDSVHEVRLPQDRGVFHPKVWVLRFVTPGGGIRYRLLVMTRNLTFDRSWDLMLVMEGDLADRVYAYSRNHPLGHLLAALPGMVRDELDGSTRQRIALVEEEVRRVDFELPEGFTGYRFWAPGVRGGGRWPFEGRIDRLLVVSPFLSAGTLKRITTGGSDHVLVSEPASVGEIDPGIRGRFAHTYTLNGTISPGVESPGEDPTDVPEDDAHELTGLHAKLYVADRGWDACMWMGSANATNAAFHGNVEFLVELSGPRRLCGVDACLEDGSGDVRFRDLLIPYIDGTKEQGDGESDSERRLEAGRQALIAAGPSLSVQQVSGEDCYRADIALAEPMEDCDDLELRCWPLTMPEGTSSRPLRPGEVPAVRFTLSMLSLTRFFAFQLREKGDAQSPALRFVLNLPARGLPSGRQEEILAHVLKNRDGVLRYLLMLLAGTGLSGGDAATILEKVAGGGWGPEQRVQIDDLPLLETLMQALDSDPAPLDRVARLLEDLRNTAPELLPREIDAVWDVVWKVRRELADDESDIQC